MNRAFSITKTLLNVGILWERNERSKRIKGAFHARRNSKHEFGSFLVLNNDFPDENGEQRKIIKEK